MSAPKVHLNAAGLRAVLNGPGARLAVEKACNDIKAAVEAQGIKVGDEDGGSKEYPIPVKTYVETTDRIRGAVSLAHAAGQAVEAKHGALGKAASSTGLNVGG